MTTIKHTLKQQMLSRCLIRHQFIFKPNMANFTLLLFTGSRSTTGMRASLIDLKNEGSAAFLNHNQAWHASSRTASTAFSADTSLRNVSTGRRADDRKRSSRVGAMGRLGDLRTCPKVQHVSKTLLMWCFNVLTLTIKKKRRFLIIHKKV